jgi:NADH dehydrogenase
MSKASQDDTLKALTNLGVVVQLNTQVVDYVDDTVFLSTGETIQTKNLIWAAGVSAIVMVFLQKVTVAEDEWLPMLQQGKRN